MLTQSNSLTPYYKNIKMSFAIRERLKLWRWYWYAPAKGEARREGKSPWANQSISGHI